MTQAAKLSSDDIRRIRLAKTRGDKLRSLAQEFNVSESTISRALAKKRHAGSHALKRKRSASEFTNVRRRRAVTPPVRRQPDLAWDLEKIRRARDDQLRGHFQQPVLMATQMLTDDALFVPYHARIAPQSAVEALIIPHQSTRGKAIAKKMRTSVITPRPVLEGIHGTLANHGIAIGYNRYDVNDDGTLVNIRLTQWPLEHVRWQESTSTLETRTDDVQNVPITHGDGRWIIFRKFQNAPWAQEACVLPASFIWGAHAHGISDWANASTSHGQAKILGQLPEGVSLQGPDDEDTLTAEAEGYLQTLTDVVTGAAGAGITPAGSTTEFLSNGSTAWQVFKELIINREKAAARIYLGTDAILGATGGAPGVDISMLFGVASTKLQGDFTALQDGLLTGLYEPWTAMNFGDSALSPRLMYQLPDPDSEGKSAENAAKLDRVLDAVQKMRAQGMIVDQQVVNGLAKDFGVSPVPQLAPDAGVDAETQKLEAEADKAQAEAAKAVSEAKATSAGDAPA